MPCKCTLTPSVSHHLLIDFRLLCSGECSIRRPSRHQSFCRISAFSLQLVQYGFFFFLNGENKHHKQTSLSQVTSYFTVCVKSGTSVTFSRGSGRQSGTRSTVQPTLFWVHPSTRKVSMLFSFRYAFRSPPNPGSTS